DRHDRGAGDAEGGEEGEQPGDQGQPAAELREGRQPLEEARDRRLRAHPGEGALDLRPAVQYERRPHHQPQDQQPDRPLAADEACINPRHFVISFPCPGRPGTTPGPTVNRRLTLFVRHLLVQCLTIGPTSSARHPGSWRPSLRQSRASSSCSPGASTLITWTMLAT